MPTDDEYIYDVVIVGAAITGMASALGLIRRGIGNILLLEKATALRPVGASIAIFSNGLRALEYLSPNVAEKVKESCIPIEKMVLKDASNGNLIHEKSPPTRDSVNYLVWYLLQQYLGDELSEEVLKMGHEVQSFEVGDNDGVVTIYAIRPDGNAVTIRSRVFVGADGIWSKTREQLFGLTNKHFHEKLMFRAALSADNIENMPPAGVNIGFQGDEHGKLFSYRETAKNIFTVTSIARFAEGQFASFNVDSIDSFSPEERKNLMCKTFKDFPADVQNILQQIRAEAIHVDAIHDIDVVERASKGTVIVIGDAAHAMSPSLGQGANQGLEDACVLVHQLTALFRSSNNVDAKSIERTLDKVWQMRRDRVRLIHGASRARSVKNNASSKVAPIDMTSFELAEAMRKIEAFEAPEDAVHI